MREPTRDGKSTEYTVISSTCRIVSSESILQTTHSGSMPMTTHESGGKKWSVSQASQPDLHSMPWQIIYLMVTLPVWLTILTLSCRACQPIWSHSTLIWFLNPDVSVACPLEYIIKPVEVSSWPRGEILPGGREHHYSAPIFEFWIWQEVIDVSREVVPAALYSTAREVIDRLSNRTIVRRDWWGSRRWAAKLDDGASFKSTASGVLATSALYRRRHSTAKFRI